MPANDPVLGFAAFHAFSLAISNGLFSLIDNYDQHPMSSLLFSPSGLKDLSHGMAKAWFEFTMILVFMFSVGYWRLYQDGPEKQPLMLCLGGVAKLTAAAQMCAMLNAGLLETGAIWLAIVPDALLGLYFLKLWSGLGYAWVPAAGGTKGA